MAIMAPPDPGPLPPADFASRALPTETISPGTRLLRIHRSALAPLFFGSTGGNRFDDPARAFGICYFSMTFEGAFAETCLRAVGARFVALSFLEARSVSKIEVTAPLNLVSLHGPGLAVLGATSAVTSGPHRVAQRWSRAVHDHPTAADTQPIMNDHDRLAALLARYKIGLG